MSDLIAINYPTVENARMALSQLGRLQQEKLIELEDAVIVERRPDGKIKLHQTGSTVGLGAAGGALWGGLIGLLFFVPLFGMALGAGMGALAGAASDVGVDDAFMRTLGAKLESGGSALVLLVRRATMDKVIERMHGQHGGELIQTSLSEEAEQRLREAVSVARAPSPVG
ncbi:MAG TPA: DUF1269 domain-containing protein [Pilimelia sp.]|nr:DUF1269 domain-containing protein [Pilimelia sp.]